MWSVGVGGQRVKKSTEILIRQKVAMKIIRHDHYYVAFWEKDLPIVLIRSENDTLT